MLKELEQSKYRNKSQILCAFNAQKGLDYNRGLMVIGRAVNGWGNDFQLEGININAITENIFPKAELQTCPMEWVLSSWGASSGYNTKKSAFWRVIRNLSHQINDAGNNWASRIVWSNLYKIAPYEGGNPSSSLCNYQFALCNELLKSEIEEYLPEHIICFTGMNWFNRFLEEHVHLKHKNDFDFVEAYGVVNLRGKESKIVIVKHPQGKPENNLVAEVLTAFSLITVN